MKPPLSDTDLLSLLHQRFGLSSFRTGQREILGSVLAGRDTLAVMPTGGGKSLCYQLPALATPGIVVVISPLIALMQDQAGALQRLGLPAGCLHSGQSLEEKQAVFAAMRASRHFLLYLSPERAQKSGFASWLAKAPVSLFAIDEAHCISQWGPDFREDYYKLSVLRELKPRVPILALTATATPTVLADISRQLQLREPDKHVYGFYRPNLYYQVEVCENDNAKYGLLKQALRQTPQGKVLIYCGTRRQTEELVNDLHAEFRDVGFYHAGLPAEERARIQKDYERSALRVLAATNAFGMGVDYPDVRLVVHYQMPANIESLYQEMGRAGRDGRESTCLLLYSKRDKGLHAYFIQQAEPETDADTIRRRWRALDTIVLFAEGAECRHAGILTYFRDSFRLASCGHCDICDPSSPRRIGSKAAPTREGIRAGRASRRPKSTSPGPLDAGAELREEILRQWRKEYAEENDIPPFLVFSNKTLRELAVKDPRSLEELGSVYGMGAQKVEYLGARLLDKLAELRD